METDYERRLRLFREAEDLYWLVDAIHYSFWVDLSVEELARAETVGQLFDLIVSKQKLPMSGGCLSQTALYRLRTALVNALGIKRSEIKPQTPLAEFMPTKTRKTQWEKLSQEVRLSVPELRYPGWLQVWLAIAFVGTAVSMFAGYRFLKTPDAGMLWMVLPWPWGAFWLAAVPALIAPFKRELPLRTVGDLTEFIAVHEHSLLVDQQGGWNQRGAMNTLYKIISEQTGVPIHKILPETRFPEDLQY